MPTQHGRSSIGQADRTEETLLCLGKKVTESKRNGSWDTPMFGGKGRVVM